MTDRIEDLQDALPRIIEGVLVTLQLTLGGALVAFLVSVVLGLVSISPVLSLIHISEPTRRLRGSRMPSSA